MSQLNPFWWRAQSFSAGVGNWVADEVCHAVSLPLACTAPHRCRIKRWLMIAAIHAPMRTSHP